MSQYDYLIVGAGITGITAASILAREKNKKIVLVEKRDHIGGNCYDYFDQHGILIHKYGPHIFHTQHRDVWQYLSRFTEWIPYVHKVNAWVDDNLVSLPINVKTLEDLLGQPFTSEKMRQWVEKERIIIEKPHNAEEVILSRMGHFIYEKLFKNYTKKQWGVDAKELAPEVTGRIPIRFNRDDRYFTDPYQGVPQDGYTRMFERMFDHRNIEVVLNTSYKEVIKDLNFDKMIYTGPIDYFFDYQFGYLPYRSFNFVFKTLNQEWFQSLGVVNYPNDYSFTRITEIKHMTAQTHPKTTICYEYPKDHILKRDVPCYPVLGWEGKIVYEKYERLARRLETVHFLGRLAEYRYLNMDACAKRALDSVSVLC